MTLDIDEILECLPHRYPFLLLDRVDELVPGKRVLARKNVSANEPYMQGHFPGHPIMPGVLVVEALAQACCVLAVKTRGRKPAQGFLQYLAGLDDVRFKRPVRPGDLLRLQGAIVSERRSLMKFDCEALADGELACSVKLICVERRMDAAPAPQQAPAGARAPAGDRAPAGPAIAAGAERDGA